MVLCDRGESLAATAGRGAVVPWPAFCQASRSVEGDGQREQRYEDEHDRERDDGQARSERLIVLFRLWTRLQACAR